MKTRPMKFPQDLTPLSEMLVETFQYPENPEWSVQTDEKEHLGNEVQSIRRLWPLIRTMQFFSQPLRDLLHGYVWEEEGEIVGATIVQRRGTSNVWAVGTVGVLPTFRRRGIARKLLETSLELIKRRGGEKVWLSVINGNLPAQSLYESLGFEVYDSTINYTINPFNPDPTPPFPEGYAVSPLGRHDWRTRYELEKRIAPENTRIYEPIEIARFRRPWLVRLLAPIERLVRRVKEEDFVVRLGPGKKIVALAGCSVSTRGKGVNTIRIRLDPEQAGLTPYLVGRVFNSVLRQSPNLRIELNIPNWMPSIIEAVETLGSHRQVEYLKMGLVL